MINTKIYQLKEIQRGVLDKIRKKECLTWQFFNAGNLARRSVQMLTSLIKYDQIFLYIQNILFLVSFWSISPIFCGKFFLKKSGCHAQLHKGFYHHAKILRNLMIQFQENAQTDGRTQDKLSTLAFNSENIEYDVSLTKNQYMAIP